MNRLKNTKPTIITETIIDTRSMFESDAIIIDNSYQRQGDAWTREKKSDLIMTVFDNMVFSDVKLNEKSKGKYELLDGQQRMTTFFSFLDNEFSLTDDISREIIKCYYPLFKNDSNFNVIIAKYDSNVGVINFKFNKLPFKLQEKLKTYHVILTITAFTSRAQVIKQFRRLQNGKALTIDDNVHTISNKLTSRTKEISSNKKILRLFRKNITNQNRHKASIKEAPRYINSALLEVVALKEGDRAMGSSIKLDTWAIKQNDDILNNNRLDIIESISGVFEAVNTTTLLKDGQDGFDVDKTDIKLIFSLIAFGKNIPNFDFDKFTKFVFYVTLLTKVLEKLKNNNNKENKANLKDALTDYSLSFIYNNNIKLFQDFTRIRKSAIGKDEMAKIINQIVVLYQQF